MPDLEGCLVPARDVDILMGCSHIHAVHWPETTGLLYYYSRSLPPSNLHVSTESRIEGLKWYRLDFGVDLDMRHVSIYCTPQIYMNWESDRVCGFVS